MKELVQQENVAEWNRRAQRHGLHAVFTKRWSEEQCLAVDALQRELVFATLPDLSKRTVLDLGCGIGRLTAPIGKRAYYTVGLDVSRKMLKRAQLAVSLSSTDTDLIQASVGRLPFSNAAFDVVVASYVLQHVLNPTLFRGALGEIGRVLSPGGIALIVDALEEKSYLPQNSTVTMIRTLEEYKSLMESSFVLIKTQSFQCVNDGYTLLLWRKR